MISYHLPGFKCPQVMPDNRSGVAEAVAHLISHGHSRIAFAGNLVQGRSDDISERYDVYLETLREHGLEPDPKLVFVGPEDGGEAIAGAMLRAGLPCTAVVAATDLIASGMVRALNDAGVKLPSRLAVVGFDDREFASRTSPAARDRSPGFRASWEKWQRAWSSTWSTAKTYPQASTW